MVTDRDSLDRDGWVDDEPGLEAPRRRPIVWLAAALALWAIIAALIMAIVSVAAGCQASAHVDAGSNTVTREIERTIVEESSKGGR